MPTSGNITKITPLKAFEQRVFLQNTKIKIYYVYALLYVWGLYVPAFVAAIKTPKLDKNSIYDFYNIYRDIFGEIMKKQRAVFDSTDKSEKLVHFDGSTFGKRQTYHNGKNNRQQMVFGIMQPDNHKCV